MRTETGPWWRQAEADLEAGRRVLAVGTAFATSWFVQRAVEKGLKALFVERNGVLPRRTHDLGFLGDEVGVPPDVRGDVLLINPVFDLVRYPDPTTGDAPVDTVTFEDAAEHLAAAERIFSAYPNTPAWRR